MRIDESTNRIRRPNILHPNLSYKINGILFEVHNDLGRYCRERQYGDLFERFLIRDDIKFSRECYKDFDTPIAKIEGNILDFLIEDKIVVELKAKRVVSKNDYYQLKRYLECLDLQLGLLVNFREEYLVPKRILNPNYK